MQSQLKSQKANETHSQQKGMGEGGIARIRLTHNLRLFF